MNLRLVGERCFLQPVKNFDVCASMKKKFALVVRKDLSAKQGQLQNVNALVSN